MWHWYRCGYPWPWMPRYWGMPSYANPWGCIPKEQEIAMLEDQAKVLEDELNSIKKRLEELKK